VPGLLKLPASGDDFEFPREIPQRETEAPPAVWGGFVGDISTQADLQDALEEKADVFELSLVAATGSYNDLDDRPTLFSGSYADLSDKPVLFSGAYSDLTGKPSLFSGAYADLTGKPTLFSGAYADLTGKPTIPAAPSDAAFGAAWDSNTDAPSKNAVYDALKASMGVYRTIIEPTGSHIAGRVAGTYGFSHGQPLAITGTGILYPLDIIYIDSADYPAVGGLTAKLRLRATLLVNDVAPTGNFVLGLHPVTRPATSGGAGLNIHTIGAAVAGSTLTFTAPAADSRNNGVGADFALPADGFYVVGMVSSATVAANSHLHFSAILQMRYS
jgi:hypothetical protein